MPLYGVLLPGGGPTALSPGDSIALFNAETPTAPAASMAIVPAFSYSQKNSVFTISFAAAATAVVVIQGSNVDADAQYQTLYTSTNKQSDYYADYGGFGFYRAQLVSYVSGGALTVIAQR